MYIHCGKENKMGRNHHFLSTELNVRFYARCYTNYISFSSYGNPSEYMLHPHFIDEETEDSRNEIIFPDKLSIKWKNQNWKPRSTHLQTFTLSPLWYKCRQLEMNNKCFEELNTKSFLRFHKRERLWHLWDIIRLWHRGI